MNNFMFLFRGSQPGAPLSPEKMQAQMQKWMNWIQQLRDQGKYIGGEPLQSGGKVVRSAGTTITDGPFVEGKEVVGGYFIVRAETLDEAAEMSKDCPIFESRGSVEVRAIQVMNP